MPVFDRRFVVALGFAAALLPAVAIADGGKPLKVGVSAGPYGDILREAAKLAEKQGLKVEVVEFSDWTQPNAALQAGDIDFNNFQHRPYLANQVKARGYTIVPLEPSIVAPAAIFSSKVTSLSDLPEGSKVAIPNDPTNAARALFLFQEAGVIKLRDGAGTDATTLDIKDNPKKLVFLELDAAQLPRSLDDVAAAYVSNNYAYVAGLDLKKALVRETAESLWTLVFAVREDRKDDPDIRRYIQIYRSPEVKAFVETKFGGTLLPAW